MSPGERFAKQTEDKNPIRPVEQEGQLNGNLGVHINSFMRGPVFLRSVKNEKDFLEQCPSVGPVEIGKEIQSESVRSVLENDPHLLRGLTAVPTGDPNLRAAGFEECIDDLFAVADDEWLEKPAGLAWKSVLIALLQAKQNARALYIQDPSMTQLLDRSEDAAKHALAEHARLMARKLREEGLGELQALNAHIRKDLSDKVEATRSRWLNYVHSEAEDEAGEEQEPGAGAVEERGDDAGDYSAVKLTEDEVNTLFGGGQ